MFPFNFLRIVLARLVLIRIDMSHVRTPVIGLEARDSKWLQQCFELQKHLILATPKDISQHLATPMITAAMLSLALNLVLTGAFILLVQWLVAGERTPTSADLVPGVHPLQTNTSNSVE
jgi:hypothetical protein